MNPTGAISRAFGQQPIRVWQNYIKHLERSPRATKSFTSVVAAVLGDSLAQYISHRGEKQWE
jgi:hypothetical protein